MIKPFVPEEWSVEIRKDFEEITSHDYERSYVPEDEQENTKTTDEATFMSHEKNLKEKDLKEI